MDQEQFGPAETLLQSLLTHTDHLYHNRPGMVTVDARHKIGVRWEPVTHKVEDGNKVVYRITKVGRKSTRTKVGTLRATDNAIVENGRVIAHYRSAGIFPEVAKWMYSQVAEVWQMDNEFAARWASFSFMQEHRDLKVVLASFMLCQSRKGSPEREGGEILFYDEDYRNVGEAMILLRAEKRDFNPKMLLRVHDVLTQDGVAAINRELGFGLSVRKPFLGRWSKGVDKWLRFREQNPRLLGGLVKSGFRTSVIKLAQLIGYKPDSEKFFETLRWKQAQSKDGRRKIALNMKVKKAESWKGYSEAKICKTIVKTKPSYKIITSRVPVEVGITRAVMAAAIEAGCLSNKDLIIATPTIEELGLLKVQDIKERWEQAVRAAEDQRAANIARNVRSKEAKETLEDGADKAIQKVVEEATKNLRVYFIVDISGSMRNAIEQAKTYLEKFLQAFPLDRLHVSVFNTIGREVKIKHASAAGVKAAFRGYAAGGGTAYGQGVLALSQYKPAEDEDALFIFVGDEGASDFHAKVRQSGLNPMAFGLLKVGNSMRHAVTNTASNLGIPCFEIDAATFEDPYSIPRTIRALVASTPVGAVAKGRTYAPRVTLVEQILKTELLQKPTWATA
jgi:hypothetical protein